MRRAFWRITAAYAALSGDEEGDAAGAADLLGGASTSLGESARLDESLAPFPSAWTSCIIPPAT